MQKNSCQADSNPYNATPQTQAVTLVGENERG